MELLRGVQDALAGEVVPVLQWLHALTGGWALALLGLAALLSLLSLLFAQLVPGRKLRAQYERAREELRRDAAGLDPEKLALRLRNPDVHLRPPAWHAWARSLLLALFAGVHLAVFAGLYRALQGPALRGAALLWIPDMTAPDRSHGLTLVCLGNGVLAAVLSLRAPDRRWLRSALALVLNGLVGAFAAVAPVGLVVYLPLVIRSVPKLLLMLGGLARVCVCGLFSFLFGKRPIRT